MSSSFSEGSTHESSSRSKRGLAMNRQPQKTAECTPLMTTDGYAAMPAPHSAIHQVPRLQAVSGFAGTITNSMPFQMLYASQHLLPHQHQQNSSPVQFNYAESGFTLSQSSFLKDEKGVAVVPSRPPSSSSAGGSNPSPKSYHSYSPLQQQSQHESRENVKTIVNTMAAGTPVVVHASSTRDKDSLSPLQVVSATSFQDGRHPNPVGLGSLANHQEALRYQSTGNDAMLSAINYNDNEILNEGSFDVTISGHLGSLDEGILSNSLSVGSSGHAGNPSFALFEGDGGHESYIGDSNTDLALSPPTFCSSSDTFGINDNTRLSGVTETSSENAVTLDDVKSQDNISGKLPIVVDKMRAKMRPTKAISPSRQGSQTCPVCGKVFGNCSALAKHKLTHSDERRYVCQMCTKAFKRQDHLNGHLLTHMNKKPYECKVDGCGKSYCDARSLRRHTEHHHSGLVSVPTLSISAVSSTGSILTVTPSIPTTSASSALASVSVIPPVNMQPITMVGTLTFTGAKVESERTPTFASTNAIIANRIQYAPPSPHHSLTFAAGSSGGTSLESVSSSAATQLQLLAFQQQQEQQSQLVSSVAPQHIEASDLPETRPANDHLLQWQQPLTMGGGQLFIGQEVYHSEPSPPRIRTPPQPSKPAVSVDSGNEDFLSRQSSHLTATALATSTSALTLHLQNKVPTSSARHQNTNIITDAQVKTEGLLDYSNSPQVITSGDVIARNLLQSPVASPVHHTASSTIVPDSGECSPIPNPWSTQFYFPVISNNGGLEPKPVECSICRRKFKNLPALNGHMRLHGGYFKKDSDVGKKLDKRSDSNNLNCPLQTASRNVLALIEEKIIKRRIVNPTLIALNASPPVSVEDGHQSGLSLLSDSGDLDHFSPSHHLQQCNDSDDGSSNALDSRTLDTVSEVQRRIEEIKRGLMAHQPPFEKFRRHSDSDHFITPKRPCVTNTGASSTLVNLLRRKVAWKRIQRTGSDPGDPEVVSAAASPQERFSHAPPPLSFPDFELLKPGETLEGSPPFSAPAVTMHVWPSPKDFDVLSAELDRSPGLSEMVTLASPGVDPEMEGTLPMSSLPLSPPSIAEVVPLTVRPLTIPKLLIEKEDDDVFLSPIPTSPIRAKKKHRPEPLHIPANLNACGFQSRLRSPRLWDPSMDGTTSSPPPYTPPPMLSPVRSGSGLFWHILSGSGSLTPKSAPITPRFTLVRQGSITDISVMPPQEDDISEAPETDIRPHVNIGANFQAQLPACNPACYVNNQYLEDLVWDPKLVDCLSEKELDLYLELSCCAAVPGGGRNKDYALHILYLSNGNIQEAILRLMNPNPRLPRGHHLLNYQYAEIDKWKTEEIEAYQQALFHYDKDFLGIAQELKSKSVKQCVQFYYLWKKVCSDDYKRLRLMRRRREQDNLYNLRSRPESGTEGDAGDSAFDLHFTPQGTPLSEDQMPSPGKQSESGDKYLCDYPDCLASFTSRQALNGHIRIHGGIPLSTKPTQVNGNSRSRSPASDGVDGRRRQQPSPSSGKLSTSTVTSSSEPPLEEFPCRICGKVFGKIKSRSAHMKSHKSSEADRRMKWD